MIKGQHLVAGEWLAGESTFQSRYTTGHGETFPNASRELVDVAAKAADKAFTSFGSSTPASRAGLLRAIAIEIEKRGDSLTQIGRLETGLPEARLIGERGRTTSQLQVFADFVEQDDFLDCRHDDALPDRTPLPRPDLRMIMRPIGPVAVFGASNFPLAFSTAGGDTASALAAGCPVIVKGHPAHPGTSEIVAQAIDAAIQAQNVDPGIFALLQDSGIQAAQDLVTHPLISAVGFTGSLQAGRILFDLCASRENPILFFGELGSTNPVFILPHALAARADTIAAGWAASMTLGAGQFCTKPGVVIVPAGDDGDTFVTTACEHLRRVDPQVILTDKIAAAFHAGVGRLAKTAGVERLLGESRSDRSASPFVFMTSADAWRKNPQMREEVFGPMGIIVRTSGSEEMRAIASELEGQLTATLHMDAKDEATAQQLLPILERKAGRLIANGFSTGVEVADAMVHGGPYPASTNVSATSVGTLAIRRFLRPVCYQNMPESLLPSKLRST
jgi:alpha-ketoglutaric semialdehyde dehydrogenase